MWKEELKNGKFQFRERYKDPVTGKWKKVSITMQRGTRQSEKEASIILNNMINEIMARYDGKTIIEGVTLDRLLDEYMTNTKSRIRPSTYYNKQTIVTHLKDLLGDDALVARITPSMISDAMENLLYNDKPVSNDYVNKHLSMLNLAFKFGIKKGYLTNNPIPQVEIKYRNDEVGKSTKS
ncbi:MAG: phage integrase SAM-like domain-containing protein, partial [Limosilactobacillus sp.]|nr:phage integrase SAM-like domain-containing protein [Limosilactobacillus sp.]